MIRKERRLRVFENRVLTERKCERSDMKMEDVWGHWKKILNAEKLHDSHF